MCLGGMSENKEEMDVEIEWNDDVSVGAIVDVLAA